MVAHDFTYPLGHIVTGSYWHNLHSDSLHLTIADTGWGKAVWGKLYGQWIVGANVFVYDHEKIYSGKYVTDDSRLWYLHHCVLLPLSSVFNQGRFIQIWFIISKILYNCGRSSQTGPFMNRFINWLESNWWKVSVRLETTPVATFPWMEPKPDQWVYQTPIWCWFDCPDGSPVEDGEQGQPWSVPVMENRLVFKEYYRDSNGPKKLGNDGAYYTGEIFGATKMAIWWFVGRADDVIKSFRHIVSVRLKLKGILWLIPRLWNVPLPVFLTRYAAR